MKLIDLEKIILLLKDVSGFSTDEKRNENITDFLNEFTNLILAENKLVDIVTSLRIKHDRNQNKEK